MYPTDEIFPLVFDFTEKDSPIEHFETLGYENANFINMSGSLTINLLISISLSIFLKLLDMICVKLYKYKYARQLGSSIKQSNVLGAIVVIYLQGFMELLISVILCIREIDENDFN